MSLLHLGYMLAIILIWGFNVVVIKLGVAEIPPFLLMSVRFALVAALLLPFFPLPRAALKPILLLSLFQGTLHFGLLFTGTVGLDSATANILLQVGTPFSALLAYLMYGERLGWKRAGGMVLAFGGVILLAGEPQLPSLLHFFLLLGSAFFWAVSNITIKQVPRSLHPLGMTCWVAVFALPQLILCSLVFEDGHWTALSNAGIAGWGTVLYTAILASLGAHTFWYALLRRYPMNRIVPFGLLAPALGVFAGIWLLGEPATWYKFAGGAVTLAGVAVIQLVRPPRREEA